MKAELEKNLGAEVTLVSSIGGVFEIDVDGKTLFSKKALGRFPEEGEIDNLVGRR